MAVLRSRLFLVASFPRPAPSVLRPPAAGAGRASPAFWRRSACFSVRAFLRRLAPSPRSCRAVVLFSGRSPARRARVVRPWSCSAACRRRVGRCASAAGRRSQLCRLVAAVVGSVFGGARFWALRAVFRWCVHLGATSPPLRGRGSVARRVGGAVSIVLGVLAHEKTLAEACQR